MPSLWTSIDAGWTDDNGSGWMTAKKDLSRDIMEEASPTDCSGRVQWPSPAQAQPRSRRSTLDMPHALPITHEDRHAQTRLSREYHSTPSSSPPAANTVPPEILSQILYTLSPRDFDNARRTCSQWMRVSLDRDLLGTMLKRAGWWDAWQRDCHASELSPKAAAEEQSLVWRMSKRFATECLLSGRKTNVERPGFLTSAVVDFSKLSHGTPRPKYRGSFSHVSPRALTRLDTLSPSRFNVSNCGSYLLVTSGRVIYIYRLLTRKSGDSMPVSVAGLGDEDLVLMSTLSCPTEVLSATIDTSTPTFVVAALLQGRMAMICDLNATSSTLHISSNLHSTGGIQADEKVATVRIPPLSLTSQRFYSNICSTDDPPRSLAVCPGRRCVAFGCGTGVELHWFDEQMKHSRKHFPMSQPAEILHFLPHQPKSPMELRLISSLAGPGMPGCQCYNPSYGPNRTACQFHLLSDVHSLPRWKSDKQIDSKSNLSLVRATHCHHYRAIPINDGLHILFIEPRTGLLCIGSDAPIGGPTSLTRALVCVPPYGKDPLDATKEKHTPTVFAAGSDLRWGLRIVAAYQDRIVLYSVPLDVFNVIRKERERQGDNVMGDSDLARDWFVEAERAHKRRGSLAQNQNGDWEFLLSVSYRPTAMMWPFKIYGKEIGRMDNVVELALQSSNGGVRVWAFSASGKTDVIDVDTFTSPTQPADTIPCKSFSVDPDGRVGSAQLVDRSDQNARSPPNKTSRKRKQSEPWGDFGGQCFASAQRLHNVMFDSSNGAGLPPGQPGLPNASSSSFSSAPQFPPLVPAAAPIIPAPSLARARRPSFAACIVDFKLPDLGPREGRWVESSAA